MNLPSWRLSKFCVSSSTVSDLARRRDISAYRSPESHLKPAKGKPLAGKAAQQSGDGMTHRFAIQPLTANSFSTPPSRNLAALERFAKYRGILDHVLSTQKEETSHLSPLLMAIQVVLTYIRFDPFRYDSQGGWTVSPFFNIFTSQRFIYGDISKHPIFLDREKKQVNLLWLLHAGNVFAYHLNCLREGYLAGQYADIWDAGLYASGWKKPLVDGRTAVGKHWRGTYSRYSNDYCPCCFTLTRNLFIRLPYLRSGLLHRPCHHSLGRPDACRRIQRPPDHHFQLRRRSSTAQCLASCFREPHSCFSNPLHQTDANI